MIPAWLVVVGVLWIVGGLAAIRFVARASTGRRRADKAARQRRVAAAMLGQDSEFAPTVIAGEDLLRLSEEEVNRRLARLIREYDAPDPALYERLYLLPEEKR